MTSKFAQRRRELERLEPRTMLAGDVTATVIDGSLLVEGDGSDNGLTLIQVAGPETPNFPADFSPDDEAVNFLIVPDAETSVNSGELGEPVFFSGITEDVAITLGDGSDVLEVNGAPGPVVANMRIQTGPGDDSVSIGRFGTSRDLKIFDASGADEYSLFATKVGRHLRFDGGADGAKASLSEVTVARPTDTSSTDLFKQALTSVNTHAKIEFVDVGGNSVMKYHKLTGVLKVDAAHFAGDLKVSATSGLDASMTESTADGDVFFKVEYAKLPNAPFGKIALDRTSIGGNLKVNSSGPLDVSLNEVKVDNDQHVVYKLKNILVSSYQAVGGSTGGDLKIVSKGVQPAIFVEDTVIGGDAVLLVGADDLARYRPPVRIVKTHIRGTMTAVVDGPTDISIDKSSLASDLFVKLGGTIAKPVPASQIEGKISLNESTVSGDLSVVTRRPLDLVISGSEMHKDSSFHYASHKNFDPSTSSIIVDKTLMLGSLRVRNDNPIPMENVSINFAKIVVDIDVNDESLKLDGGSPGKYNVHNTEIGRDLVITPGTGRLKGGNSRGNADAALRNSVVIADSKIGGNLAIQGSTGNDHIRLERIDVGGITRVATQAGDDYLQVLDSVFSEAVIFHGGRGTDTLLLRGNQFEARTVFRSWESLLPPPDDPNVD